jgi:hypothetical protein
LEKGEEMNSDDEANGEEVTPAGAIIPQRDASGTPSDHDKRMTEEAKDAIDDEPTTGRTVGPEEGRIT